MLSTLGVEETRPMIAIAFILWLFWAWQFCGMTEIYRTGKWRRAAPIRSHTALPRIYPANSLSIAINWVTLSETMF